MPPLCPARDWKQHTQNESLLKEIQHEYEEEDCVWEKVRDDLAKILNGRFRGTETSS